MSGETRKSASNWWRQTYPEPEGGRILPPGVADALKSLMLHADKQNWGRAIDYKPNQPKIIPSSLCGPVFLRKVISGNIR